MRYALGYILSGSVVTLSSLWILCHLVYLVFDFLTGQGASVAAGWSFENWMWIGRGTVFAVAFSVMGAALGIYTTGISIFGGGANGPKIKTRDLYSALFCEVIAIYGQVYGLITALVLSGLLEQFGAEGVATNELAGCIIFGAGLSVGLVNLFCGVAIGIVGSGDDLTSSSILFLKIFMIALCGSVIALIGFICIYIQYNT